MKRLLATTLTAVLCAGCSGSKTTGACADPLMIDDMEDGDRFIRDHSGRHGAWYTVDDGTSTNLSPRGDFTQMPIPGGRDGSSTAARMTGFGFTITGAAMGFSLNGEGASAQPYDASATGGVRFWLKSDAQVYVQLPIPETMATGAVAACADDVGKGKWNCDNHFSFRITAPTSDAWTEYDIPYAALAQRHDLGPEGNNVAGTAGWDPSRVVGVQFRVDSLQTFDVWVDDVRFYSCASSTCVPTCTDPGLPVACPATSASPASCRAGGANCASTLSADLPGVWGIAPDDVWAVGYGGTILHWNGSVWSGVASGTTEYLSLAWGSASDDVWTVGVNGTILHWAGSSWLPSVSGTTQPIYGVWGSGPDDVWAVGGAGTILHWDGVTWSPVASGTSYQLWRVWGSSSTDVWAVGGSTTPPAGVITHWDGARWSVVPDGAPPDAHGVHGTGPNDVWAVGGWGAIAHWNGSAWSDVPSPTDVKIYSVWAGGLADAWAVGREGTTMHWNGSSWSIVPTSTSTFLLHVWASGPSDVWAVGGAGTILHWDGDAWSVVPVEVQ